MNGCEALIFDVDGTLADTEDVHRQAFNHAFREHGLDWYWDPALYEELLQVTGGKQRLQSHIERLGLPSAEYVRLRQLVPELHAAKTRRYTEIINSGQVVLRPGVEALMRAARQAGVRLAIASTTSPENIEALLAAALGPQALTWFDTIASGDIVANMKPAPDIYNVALEALRIEPAAAIALEDSALGVQSAKAAGLFTVATPCRWTSSQDLSAADLVIGSLGDLTLKGLTAFHAASRRQEIRHAHAH